MRSALVWLLQVILGTSVATPQMADKAAPSAAPRMIAAISPGSGKAAAGGILTADRDARANWRTAGMLSRGGIPSRSKVCAKVGPLGNQRDDTANIQDAINSCPLGQVVSLAAGVFTIAEGNFVLLNKGITLRGAGPGVTTLQRTNGAKRGTYQPGSKPSPLIIVGPMRWNNDMASADLAADVAAGAKSVELAGTVGLSVGQIVLLDEASGAAWQTDVEGLGQIWAAPDYRVVWQKHNPSRSWDDFSSATFPNQPGTAGCWFSNCDRLNRPQLMGHRVEAYAASATG